MVHRCSTAALWIRPRPSAHLAWFLFASHGASFLVVSLLPLAWPVRALLGLAVLLSLLYEVGLSLWPCLPWGVREVQWGADGSWLVTHVSGVQKQATLAPSTLVTVGLIVLDLRCGRLRHCYLPLFADSLAPDQHRRLRARLRLLTLQGNPDRTSS